MEIFRIPQILQLEGAMQGHGVNILFNADISSITTQLAAAHTAYTYRLSASTQLLLSHQVIYLSIVGLYQLPSEMLEIGGS